MAAERVADCLSMELPLLSESLAPDEQEGLAPDLARRYGTLAAKLMYLAHDRPDFAHTAKGLMRKLASPRQCDWARLLTLGRYLLRQPTVAWFPRTPHSRMWWWPLRTRTMRDVRGPGGRRPGPSYFGARPR